MESDVGQNADKFNPAMTEENPEAVYDSPALNATVDNVVRMFKSLEEEVQKLVQKKWDLEVETEHLKKVKQLLELEKAEIDGEITRLRLRDTEYQKEHTQLRNSITVAKFQIEKIKDSIAAAKADDLKALEDFERSVDEVTEKFRAGPMTYDRSVLLEKVETEKKKRDALIRKLEAVKESYDSFNGANGLRARAYDSEELLNCVLPHSSLSCIIEMTKTLDDVISEIKNLTGEPKENEKKF